VPTTQQRRTAPAERSFLRDAPTTNSAKIADWPFWKVIPRFVRESTTADFANSMNALWRSEVPGTALEEHFSTACIFDYSESGRECLYLILRSLGLPKGSRVGVPLYCCDAVFMAIGAAGFVPVFLDIDLNSYSLDEESVWRHRKQLDALIVVHTFGYPTNIARIQELLPEKEIPVIEDCAHSLFSDYMGVPTGSWTQASFFTFGSHKPAAAGGGGMSVINNPEIAANFRSVSGRREHASRNDEIRRAVSTWLRGMCYARPLYGALLAGVPAAWREGRINESGYRDVHGGDPALTTHIMRRVDRALVERSVDKFRGSLAKLAAHAASIRDALEGTALETPNEPSYGTWNHFMVPVRYASESRRHKGREFLRKKRVDTSPLYQNCVRNAAMYDYRGGCPNSELASQTVCTVPNHAWMSDKEMQHVCDALRLSC
jgi:perosamine synthetase